MSDTQIFGRRLSGQLKAVLVYTAISAIASICLAVGGAFFGMKKADWTEMWWMQRWGWALMLAGNVLVTTLTTFKAATSSSTREAPAP